MQYSLMGTVKRGLKAILPRPLLKFSRILYSLLVDADAVKSYAQEGEDMILRKLFAGRETGFYIDVGAHHPTRFSNTHYFYRRGWSGINVDATPGSMASFQKRRPRDINLEIAIANSKKELTFFIFDEPALNSFDESLSRARDNEQPRVVRIIKEQKIMTRTLNEVLSQHMPSGQHIDFLSVDVEGLDYDVLLSNDWSKFRPECVLVECLGVLWKDLAGDMACQFLNSCGYQIFAKTLNTAFFRDQSQKVPLPEEDNIRRIHGDIK